MVGLKLSRVVKTQVEYGKYIKVDDTKAFNTEPIYTRVIGIQAMISNSCCLMSCHQYPQQCFQILVK